MKTNNFLLALMLCAGLRLNAVATETAVQIKLDAIKTEKLIEDKVDRILALIKEEKENLTEEQFSNTKDTNPLFNSTDNDIDITREAKKRVKNQLFPEETEVNEPTKSYWQMYAPQFVQDATSATSGYIASWIPQSIRERVNSWSTRKKVIIASAALASLAAIYNRDQIIAMINQATMMEEPTATQVKTISDQASSQKPLNELNAWNEWDVQRIIASLTQPNGLGPIPLSPKELKEIYLENFPDAENDPLYKEAITRLNQALGQAGIRSYKYGVDLTENEIGILKKIASEGLPPIK